MTGQQENVYRVTGRIIRQLEAKETAGQKDTALLADFRNSAGKPLSQAESVWPFLFENVPSEFLSRTGKPTAEENAIFTAMQLYAICKQGTSHSVNTTEDGKWNMGHSLGRGRTGDQAKALDRRFNAMITAESFEEFTYHLRQMTRLVRAKTNFTVNFSKLAEDLFRYQRGWRDQVCLRWAESYYAASVNTSEDTEEKGENK